MTAYGRLPRRHSKKLSIYQRDISIHRYICTLIFKGNAPVIGSILFSPSSLGLGPQSPGVLAEIITMLNSALIHPAYYGGVTLKKIHWIELPVLNLAPL